MSQQFKFGDMVKSRMHPNKTLGLVVDAGSNQYSYIIRWEHTKGVSQEHTESLELIPHPDTVRLDWLIETCRGIDNNADTTYLDGTPFPQYSVINSGTDRAANWYVVDGGDHDDPRQAIDNAMKAEQQK